jgi:hypothetical protein
VEEHTRCAPEDGDHQLGIPTVAEIKAETALAGDPPATLRIDLVHCWWECKLVQPPWKKIWRLPYDPAIPLLRIYPKECDSGYSRGTCTPMFIAVLFTITNLWKQPRCPTIDEWIKKMWYLYTMEFYSAMKKNEILSFAGKWVELDIVILRLARLRRPKIICSPSYADFRSRVNTAV